MIERFPLVLAEKTRDGIEKEKIERGVIVRHLFLPGRFSETADTLEWLKHHADGKALISLSPIVILPNSLEPVESKILFPTVGCLFPFSLPVPPRVTW